MLRDRRIFAGSRLGVLLTVLLLVISFAGTSCNNVSSASTNLIACGLVKKVKLSKLLTPSDRSFYLSTPLTDSALLSTSCEVSMLLRFGYYDRVLQDEVMYQNHPNHAALFGTLEDTTKANKVPLVGLMQRGIFHVDDSWVFKDWAWWYTHRSIDTSTMDFEIYVHDHGSHPGKDPNGVGVYSIATQLLPTMTNGDSSVWVEGEIDYYDGKN